VKTENIGLDWNKIWNYLIFADDLNKQSGVENNYQLDSGR
jgi:hypothetical protein